MVLCVLLNYPYTCFFTYLFRKDVLNIFGKVELIFFQSMLRVQRGECASAISPPPLGIIG